MINFCNSPLQLIDEMKKKLFKATKSAASKLNLGASRHGCTEKINVKRQVPGLDFRINRVTRKQKETIVKNINKNEVKDAFVLIVVDIELESEAEVYKP